MIRLSRPARRCLAVVWLGSAASIGCASSRPHGTHEGALLDHEVTADRVHAALRRAGPEFRDVEVRASKEGVSLTGTVGSAELRRRAEEIAKEVDARVTLKNRITVR